MSRPYFNSGIAELEALFDESKSDQAVCRELIRELKHRKNPRAKDLLDAVQAQLAQERQPVTDTGRGVASVQRPKDAIPQVSGDSVILSEAGDAAPSTRAGKPSARESETAEPVFIPMPEHVGQTPYVRGQRAEDVEDALAVLSAWIAIEALSPQTYRTPADLALGEASRIRRLDNGELPWIRGESSKPGYQLYYQVLLGAIPMDRATDELIKVFGDNTESVRREREKAVVAAVLLDRHGFPLEEDSVALSSFAWALPRALSGDLASLGEWPKAEKKLVEELTCKLRSEDEEGNALPVDLATIQTAFDWLVQELRLPTELYERPSLAIRVYQHIKAKGDPETSLLNSFFLGDLARAKDLIGPGTAGRALSRFMGIDPVERSVDLLKSRELVEELVAPAKAPAARWPAPGGFPLVALQQMAINAARQELGDKYGGTVAVNGPPGTGKTTLLRDVVAACVLDRATAMARFEDATKGFDTTGQKIASGGGYFNHIYSLHASLKGHEVLVASSNNKAVENVSRELPGLEAVEGEQAYFKSISDRLFGEKEVDGNYPESTWGLIAAVLGNSSNRYQFQQAVWWDDDRSLRLYLKAAKGDSVVREVKDEEGNLIRRETPSVIALESPPTPDEAAKNWKRVRKEFRKLKKEVDSELKRLESIRETCLKLRAARQRQSEASTAVEKARALHERQLADVRLGESRLAAEQGVYESAREKRTAAFARRPGWLHRLFRTRRFREWDAEYRPLNLAFLDAETVLGEVESQLSSLRRELGAAEASFAARQTELAAATTAADSLQMEVDENRPELGDRMVDDAFFGRGHQAWNKESPWLPDHVHRLRVQLFDKALAVHKAFLDVNAGRAGHNLSILMGAMQAGALKDEAKRKYLPDLWATLFMVCPVLSTTFASVERMLGDMPPKSLGWLLVDEAGQATPQAAVGALMRAQKAIIVGDPLQIPPVVSLPDRLLSNLATYFGIERPLWLAPDASVQTVADLFSRYNAVFSADMGVREVGLPLLVHRRCQEPMFGISNRMAYDDQMVHAVGRSGPGDVATILGPSAWLNVDGTADSKWCPAEGRVVVDLLQKLANNNVKNPDIYIITPFRVVAFELRRLLAQNRSLLEQLGVTSRDWLKDRIGTIHTFQGKEAEAVIAVLGAPEHKHQGARKWAAGTPNIFNVMVSRAKRSLYVVGSRAAWSVGHGKLLVDMLPERAPKADSPAGSSPALDGSTAPDLFEADESRA